MEHEDAIGSRCAERYAAGELSPEERDLFEEHFFECPECAEEVRWEQIFGANVRAVAREIAAPARRPTAVPWWRAWLPQSAFAFSLAANAILVAGLGYAVLTRTPAGKVRLVPAYFAPPPSRAVEEPRTLAPGSNALAVHFPIPDQNYPSFSYEVTDSAGSRKVSGELPTPPGSEGELYLELPVSRFAAGVYTLTVRGNPGNEVVARLRFRTMR